MFKSLYDENISDSSIGVPETKSSSLVVPKILEAFSIEIHIMFLPAFQ